MHWGLFSASGMLASGGKRCQQHADEAGGVSGGVIGDA